MIICVQVLGHSHALISLGYTSRRAAARGAICLAVVDTAKMVFQCGCTSSYPYQQGLKLPATPYL